MDRHGEESLMIELFLIVALILLVPCVVVSGWIGKTYGRNDIKKQAVQAGVAKWTVDKDGVVEFQWIKETEKSKMTIDDLVATIESKMNQAKADYFRVLDLANTGKASPIKVSYHNGLYDGLERAWREAVFAKIEMEKSK